MIDFAKTNKTADRYLNANSIDLEKLLIKAKANNENTNKSTRSWLKVWQDWALARQYDAEIENYPPEMVDKALQKFYAEVRTKKDEDYEPDSLKVMRAALDRHLKNKNYPYSIIRDREFHHSKQILEGKARQLCENGRGKRPMQQSH